MNARAVLVALLAGALLTAVACAPDDDDEHASDASPESCAGAQGKSASACSTGPQYPEEYDYPFAEDDLAIADGCLDPTSPPLCTPHCSAQTPLGARSYCGLPSGSCASEGEVCSMRAAPAWCFTTGLGARGFVFHCSCTSGSWSCVKMRNSWIVASGCGPGPDASTDASTDAAD